MSNNQSSNDRLDRIETALESLISVVADLQKGQMAMQQEHREMQQEHREMQQEHLQLVRIVAQQQNHIVEMNAKIQGLQTETLRIMQHLFGQQQQDNQDN